MMFIKHSSLEELRFRLNAASVGLVSAESTEHSRSSGEGNTLTRWWLEVVPVCPRRKHPEPFS